MEIIPDYKKYKWFFTLSGKLVVGGKSAIQNDELLKRIKETNKNFIVMHTSSPGSPFSIILADTKKVTNQDKEEAAIFTACFSQSWKSESKKASVDVFSSSQLYKSKGMKTGTWGVAGSVHEISVPLRLVLTKQDSELRAVPEKSVKNYKDVILKIHPGKIDKKDILPKIALELGDNISQSELLSALPAGGLAISKK